jgi:hypothetical protein
VGIVPVNLLELVRQLISDFSCADTELVPLLVLLLPPLVLLLPPLVLLLPPLVLLLVSLLLVSLLLVSEDFFAAKAGELKAPAVTRIIAVRTTMIATVVDFIYITKTLCSYIYKELRNNVN